MHQSQRRAGRAVALSIAEVIHPIVLNQPKVLPVSSQLTGEYGVKGTCTSVPTLVGKGGVLKRFEIELWPREAKRLQASCKAAGRDLGTDQVEQASGTCFPPG